MKIKTVGYGTTRDIGNYENCKVYLEAEVDEGENVDKVLSALRQQADSYAHQHTEISELSRAKDNLDGDISSYLYKIKCAQEKFNLLQKEWEKAKAFLQHHGVEVKANFPTPPSLYDSTKELLGGTDTESQSEGEDLDDIPFKSAEF